MPFVYNVFENNQFYDLVFFFRQLWGPTAKWNSRKKMVENVTDMDLLYWNVIFVSETWATEQHEMNE